MLVDGLWNAGAEAIAVNDLRLTDLTAFANVGPAVHIGKVPLVAPYTIQAIGDPDTLAADLLDTHVRPAVLLPQGQPGVRLRDRERRRDARCPRPRGPEPADACTCRTTSGNRPDTDGGVEAP